MTTPIANNSLNNHPAHLGTEQTHQARVDRAISQLIETDAEPSSAPLAETLVRPVQQINETLRPYAVEFDLHQQGNDVVVRIIDQENGDVIRQVPAEEVLRIADRLDELQGLLFDSRA